LFGPSLPLEGTFPFFLQVPTNLWKDKIFLFFLGEVPSPPTVTSRPTPPSLEIGPGNTRGSGFIEWESPFFPLPFCVAKVCLNPFPKGGDLFLVRRGSRASFSLLLHGFFCGAMVSFLLMGFFPCRHLIFFAFPPGANVSIGAPSDGRSHTLSLPSR